MSKVYAAQSVAKKHIIEQCENCNLKKNSNGLYNHDNIVKVQETIEGKLNEVFLDHDSGLGMIKLLDTSKTNESPTQPPWNALMASTLNAMFQLEYIPYIST